MSTPVTITTAIELSAKQLDSLAAQLTKKLGKIEVTAVVDPELIGGLKVRVGSREYDGSLQHKLNSVKQQLLAEW